MDSLAPDYLFADAIIIALAQALGMATPDDAAAMHEVCGNGMVQPEPEEFTMPFGCVRYAADGHGKPKVVPQIYIDGKKTSLGHYPYTRAGADLASRVRAAAVAVKQAGGDAEAIKRAARAVREAS